MPQNFRILMQQQNGPILFANSFYYETKEDAVNTAHSEQQSSLKAKTFTFTIIDVYNNKIVETIPAKITEDAL